MLHCTILKMGWLAEEKVHLSSIKTWLCAFWMSRRIGGEVVLRKEQLPSSFQQCSVLERCLMHYVFSFYSFYIINLIGHFDYFFYMLQDIEAKVSSKAKKNQKSKVLILLLCCLPKTPSKPRPTS